MKNTDAEKIIAEIASTLFHADCHFITKIANTVLSHKVKFDIVTGFTQEDVMFEFPRIESLTN